MDRKLDDLSYFRRNFIKRRLIFYVFEHGMFIPWSSKGVPVEIFILALVFFELVFDKIFLTRNDVFENWGVMLKHNASVVLISRQSVYVEEEVSMAFTFVVIPTKVQKLEGDRGCLEEVQG